MGRFETIFPVIARVPELSRWLELLGLASFVTFSVSLVVVPWIIILLPEDFFLRHWERVEQRHQRHPLLTAFIFGLRNLVGGGLIIAGLIMLLLPGQGVLTVLVGIAVADFPGKHRLLNRFIREKKIQGALNWIRKKADKADFFFPGSEPAPDQ